VEQLTWGGKGFEEEKGRGETKGWKNELRACGMRKADRGPLDTNRLGGGWGIL